MQKFLATVSILMLLGATLDAAETPNFIIINTDDLGFADIGPFGSDNDTPNLDRMAAEGRKLTSHYAAPVCSPSRASLMTGCYPKRALPIQHVLFPAAEVGLHPNEITVAEILKEAGYATACIGKWHLGDQPEFLPTRQGFDSYYGIPYSNDMGPRTDGAKSNPDQPLPKGNPGPNVSQNRDETGIRGNAQPPLPLLENETVVGRVRAEDQFEITRRYTERAVDFIRAQRDKPFFLYLPQTAVHFPLYPSDDFRGKSANGLLGDWAQEVDWSVGQILKTLRDEKLDSNTLVIFTSDNGGSVRHGSDNSPLRGSKGQTYEGGIRVCTIAWWPGKIPGGTSTDAITSMMDILPTFTHLANAKLPTDRTLDGVNIWTVLSGEPDSNPPRDQFLYFRGLTLEAVRGGHWKLHLAKNELYNLADDIGETQNVATMHPDIVARLRSVAAATDEDLGRTGVGPGCRPLGRVHNPRPLIALDGTVRPDFAADQKRFP